MLSEDSASRGLQLLVARTDFQQTLGPFLHRLHGYGAGNGLLPFSTRRHGTISHTLHLALSKTVNGSYPSSLMSPSAFYTVVNCTLLQFEEGLRAGQCAGEMSILDH